MELYTLNTLMAGNPVALMAALNKGFKPLYQWEAFKHYDILKHDVNSRVKRKKKDVRKPSGEYKDDGSAVMVETQQEVTRIGIPMQKLIVETAATFLTGGVIELQATSDNDTEENLIEAVRKTWTSNKLQFKNNGIAEAMMSQTEVAELWYSDKDNQGRPVMKMRVLQPKDGYILQPVFDALGDLIAFGVAYQATNENAQAVKYYDLYTDTEIRKYHLQPGKEWALLQLPVINSEGLPTGAVQDAIIPLPYKKIPIIYYSQQRSEWYDVQQMIERLETMASDHGDTNQYFGSPILFVNGEINGFADKGETGKIITANNKDAKAAYITPDNATDSYKLEYDNLMQLIMLCSQTPNLSLDNLKGLGQITSGAALERILIATYMKARRRQVGDFGEAMQRRINFLKAACVFLDSNLATAQDIDITPQFTQFSIDDLAEKINMAMVANGGQPVMSQLESIRFVGKSQEPEKTLQAIRDDETAKGNTFGAGAE